MNFKRQLSARLSRSPVLDAPSVAPIEMQVRTGASVPFAPHMLAGHEDPQVGDIEMQVRTGASVPFASYMVSEDPPSARAIDMQVRTGASVPFASYMTSRGGAVDRPVTESVGMQVRTGASVPFNPYMLGAHAEELLRRRVMISPVLVVWSYRIANETAFKGWLATREILLSEGRVAGDEDVRGIRYGGTYKLATEGAEATYRTIWGYTSEIAMATMHRLCSEGNATATLIQLELVDFVKGLKRFVAEAGEAHFSQDVLVSASAGQVD